MLARVAFVALVACVVFAVGARAGGVVAVEVNVEGSADVYGFARDLEAVKHAARAAAVEAAIAAWPSTDPVAPYLSTLAADLALERGVVVDERWGPLQTRDHTGSVGLDARVVSAALRTATCALVRRQADTRVAVVFVDPVAGPAVAPLPPRDFVDAFAAACLDAVIVRAPVAVRADVVALQTALGRTVVVVRETGSIHDERLAQVKIEISQHPLYAPEGTAHESLGGWVERPVSSSLAAGSFEAKKLAAGAARAAARSLALSVESQCRLGDARLELVVTGAPTDKQLDALERDIGKLAPARVERRAKRGSNVTFTAFAADGVEQLAEALDGKAVGDSIVEVIELTRGRLILRLNPKR